MKIKLLAIFPKRIIDIFVADHCLMLRQVRMTATATLGKLGHCERGTGAPRSRGDGVTLSGLILVFGMG